MSLLTDYLSDPACVRAWQPREWNRFLPLLRESRLMTRALCLAEAADLIDAVPARIVDQMIGARAQTRYVQVQAMRELGHVLRALQHDGIRVAALKGIAYRVADLPLAQWRGLSDIDLLIDRADLARAEALLLRSGWVVNGEFDDYDQRYYREWMHEVPPLRHAARETEVDLHHNLSPPVSRVRIDATALWREVVDVDGPGGLPVGVLSDCDMLLHNAVHLFMNDELRGGLRDVMDFRDLYMHFGALDAGFERRLLDRAETLQCGLPLYYAVDTAQRLVALAPGKVMVDGLSRHRPSPFPRLAMRWLIDHALAPDRTALRTTALANWLLFVRSHWIRMPKGMLLRHLLRKTMKRRAPVSTIQETPG
ncbi:MAG: nucleotidyltransferase family protein [Gammaproteobacteria bacterium]|nr:nucleotidyltransferase family protein [Gammaproteobacteria bacterium]